jgi:hypothetical protein
MLLNEFKLNLLQLLYILLISIHQTSVDYYVNVKMTRGDATTNNNVRNEDYFNSFYNKSTYKDTDLLNKIINEKYNDTYKKLINTMEL